MRKINFLFVIMLTAFSLFSCSQDDVILTESDADSNTTFKTLNGQIPFAVENVQNALVNVLNHYSKTRPAVVQRFAAYQVNTTHMYYKFMPADSLQYAALMEQDDVLGLTTDPFEHNVVERTEDPAEDEIPVFYAVVSVETQLPEVPYQVVAELHFTDEDKLEDIPANYDEVEFKQNLMYEARKLSGHLDDEELAEGYMNYEEGFDDSQNKSGNTTYGLFRKKWRPSGTVRVEEDWLSERSGSPVYVPVYRAEVNVLKWGWLRVENSSTDNNGNFSTGTTYTHHVHYNVKFADFVRVYVRPGNFFDIANWKSDSHKKRALNVTFVKDTKHQFYALINNAAHDYFDRVVPTYGIYNPNFVDISGHYNDHKSNYWFGWIPFRSEVKIGGKRSDGTRKKSDEVYATVIHEITHKSHYKMDSGAFNSFGGSAAKHKLFLRESWAECVETIATNDKYGQLFAQYNLLSGNYVSSTLWDWNPSLIRNWNGNRQYQTIAEMDEYSPLIIDLMDTHNQNTFNSTYPVDFVSGYTLTQIQTALNGSHTVDAFYNKLFNLYNNSTKVHLDTIKGYANTVVNNL